MAPGTHMALALAAALLAACPPPTPAAPCQVDKDCAGDRTCDPFYRVCVPVPPAAGAADHALEDAAPADRWQRDGARVDGGDPFSAWHWRVRLSFDHRAASEDLVDFPALVVLDGVRVPYADLAASGADLRFVDADGVTLLAHEVESWDSSGRSFIWVRVPRITAGVASDFIWLYYGNPAARSAESPAAVWSNHFRAVYHLDSDRVDATAGAAPAISHGVITEAALVGHGARFPAGTSYLDLGTNLVAVQGIGGCTISLWVKPDTVSTSPYLVSYSIHLPGDLSRASVSLAGSNLQVWGRSIDEEASQDHITTGANIGSGTWSHLVGTIDYPADTVAAYVNGASAGSSSVVFASPTTPHTPSANNALGAEDDGSARFYAGLMDEVRLAGVVRSADWIAAEYRSGRDDGFVVYGVREAH